jgi:hypothetical protein
MDWEKAEQHVRSVLKQYTDAAGMPSVSVGFGIMVLEALLRRYTAGERTPELYEAMMGAE